MRICSINRPERSPARPALAPATDRSWQGEPPQMICTGGSFAPSSCVISPTWTISGNRSFVTSMGNASISLAHTGMIPLRTAARGKPPIPSNRLPMVNASSVFFTLKHHLPIKNTAMRSIAASISALLFYIPNSGPFSSSIAGFSSASRAISCPSA